MFDRLKVITSYTQDIQEAMAYIATRSRQIDNNLILLTVNTLHIYSILTLTLEKEGIQFHNVTYSEFYQGEMLFTFLSTSQNEVNAPDAVLILDFMNELQNPVLDDIDIANILNVNRDLLTKHYSTVIVLAPCSLSLTIRRSAPDYWSCVETYYDLTRWFCNPFPIPIIDIDFPTQIAPMIIKLRKEDAHAYAKYLAAHKYIASINRITSQNISDFTEMVSSLKDLSCFYILLHEFSELFNTLHVTPANWDTIVDKIESVVQLCPCSAESLNIYLRFARLCYRYGKYSTAIKYYQLASQISFTYLDKTQYSDTQDFVAHIQCNIVVCKYLQAGKQEPQQLLSDVKLRLKDLLDSDIATFESSYLLVLHGYLEHHSYAQHIDLFHDLSHVTKLSVNYSSILEAFQCLYLWEYAIVRTIVPTIFARFESPISILENHILSMLRLFQTDDYTATRVAYRAARYYAASHGYTYTLKILNQINRNMIFLHSKSSPSLK